jgi:hypothetical protein
MDYSMRKFQIGDRVENIKGDYWLAGEVRGIVFKRSGKYRYVIEDDRGLLFIFNAMQLKLLRSGSLTMTANSDDGQVSDGG